MLPSHWSLVTGFSLGTLTVELSVELHWQEEAGSAVHRAVGQT